MLFGLNLVYYYRRGTRCVIIGRMLMPGLQHPHRICNATSITGPNRHRPGIYVPLKRPERTMVANRESWVLMGFVNQLVLRLGSWPPDGVTKPVTLAAPWPFSAFGIPCSFLPGSCSALRTFWLDQLPHLSGSVCFCVSCPCLSTRSGEEGQPRPAKHVMTTCRPNPLAWHVRNSIGPGSPAFAPLSHCHTEKNTSSI